MHLIRKLLLQFAFLCCAMFFMDTIMAQDVTVSGKVIDSATNLAIVNASVVAKTGSKGTVTDANGAFKITVANGTVLVISSLNYVTQEVVAGKDLSVNVSLAPKSSELNNVVVIGYGTRQKKDLTAAVSVVTSKDITKSTALSPELAMQGQMAGVSVISAGGSPSARPTVRIRGVSSFNSADPLYVIDGIPIQEGGAGTTTDPVNDPTRRTPVNLYTIINPNDIESITVLKDASATAPYGVRGANGVILITTKSGKKGKVKVDVDVVYGTSKLPGTYDVLNTQQYVKFITDAYNAHPELNPDTGEPVPIGEASRFGAVWDPASPDYLGNSATYDWQDAITNHDAKIQNYNVRLSGASDNTAYNVSAAYANNDGPFIGVNAERYSVSANLRSNVSKYLEVGFNVRAIQERNKDGNYGGVTSDLNAYKAAPWQAIYDPSNKYGYAPLWVANQPITPDVFDYSPVWQSTLDAFVPISNYLANLVTNDALTQHQTFFGGGYVQVQPITGLKVKGSLNGQQLTISTKGYTSFDNWMFNETPGNPYGSVKDPVAGLRYNSVSFGNSITTSLTKALNVDYAHRFGEHGINITLDASQQETIWSTNGGNGFITTDNPDLRYLHPNGTQNAYLELRSRYVLIGYFGRMSYNYAGKYYIDVMARRDGSSRFAEGHQWGTFPAVSGAWRISEEDFMKSVVFINDLKLRGGYGVLGNEQTTGGWKYLSTANVVPPSYNVGNPNGVRPAVGFGNFANSELTWEKKHGMNIGLDAVLLDSRLNVSLEYFRNVTKGVIQSVSFAPTAGFEFPADLNIADVLNRGVELQVGYNRTFGKVNFSANANLTMIHNEILALANHTALRGAGLEEGLPIGFIYGYKEGGIFQDQKQIDDWNAANTDQLSTEQKPGDMYFQDLYGQPTAGSTAKNLTRDSLVDENDQTYLGKTIPGYDYGFTLSANYKGFDVSVFFHGVADVQKFNAIRAAAESMNTNGRNQFSSVLNAWTESNRSTVMPRAVYGDPNQNNRFSDRFVENASYLRLQNLQVGYTIPKHILDKTNAISNFRIYFSGVNLFTITKYSGLDPENEAYPSTRQYLIGVNASF